MYQVRVMEDELLRELYPEIRQLDRMSIRGLCFSNALCELASERGWQLVAPRKKPKTGLGHRRHSAPRLRSIELLETGSLFGRALYRRRTSIESIFGAMGNVGCGLGPLPNWVRRLPRVRRWVQIKVIIHHVRLAHPTRLAA